VGTAGTPRPAAAVAGRAVAPAADAPGAALGWADLAGARVGLWGLRMEGAANLRRLRAMGVVPVAVDDHPAAPAFGGLPVLHGAAGLEALATCEVVVKSPGISRHSQPALDLVRDGVVLAGGLGLWLADADRTRVVCITGTKGKSTTAALTGHLLRGLGRRCLVAGNIGLPPWDPDAGDDWDVWVVETSSYQATDVAVAPPVVAVTSLAPDHLDWHGGVERYYEDKLSLCSRPGARLTVADGTSETLRAHASLLGPSVRWVADGDPELDGPWVDGLALPGRHYHRDALLARACLLGLGVTEAADEGRMALAAPGFSPLEHRFRPLGAVAGVLFIDDGLSTNVLPTLAALEALGRRPVALLAGGQDRGIDYEPLGRALARRGAPTMVATLPASGPRIRATIESALATAALARPGDSISTTVEPAAEPPALADFLTLPEATFAAFEWALPRGGVVLLSPAAPSFGQFRDYRERSTVFDETMRRCAASIGAEVQTAAGNEPAGPRSGD
jgi:UDP-N-acetylmuramoyl-L-alanine---L-glutamate ligase